MGLAPPEFGRAAAWEYRTRLSGRISRCSLRINGIRHQENRQAPGEPTHMDGTTRHVRHYLQRDRIKSRKIRDTMRRNTRPRRGDKEHGGRRDLDPSLRSATSSHEPWSRNFQDTIRAQTPNPRRDEVSLGSLLQRQDSRGLEAEVGLKVRGHLPYKSTFLRPLLASFSPRLFPPSSSSSGRLPLQPAPLPKLALRLRPARKPAASKNFKHPQNQLSHCWTSRTSRWKGSFRISRSVVRW